MVLALGMLISGINLARRKSPIASGIFLALLGAGLWAVLGLPAKQIPFALLGLGALGAGAGMVLSRNPATSAVFMMAAFVSLAGVYLLMGFPFIAMVQIMVYAGAIVVLFLFVVMLLDIGRIEKGESDISFGIVGALVSGAILGTMVVAFIVCGGGKGPVFGAMDPAVLASRAAQAVPKVSGGAGFAKMLFGKYLLPFEAVTLLLIAALVGVILLARNMKVKKEGTEDA